VHGQQGADELAATVDRNLKFRDTYNKVVENSQTAQRNAAAKEMKPDPSTDTPLFNPNSTIPGIHRALYEIRSRKMDLPGPDFFVTMEITARPWIAQISDLGMSAAFRRSYAATFAARVAAGPNGRLRQTQRRHTAERLRAGLMR
jgi:hypothetical protein